MKFSFFLKDAKKDSSLIYLVARAGDDRIKISTGLTVSTKSWSADNARVKKNNSGQELNARLDQIDSFAKEIFNRARILGITDIKELFAFVKNGIVESGLLDRRNTDTTTILASIDEFIKQLKQGTRPTKRKICTTVSYSYLQLFQTIRNFFSELLPDNAPLP